MAARCAAGAAIGCTCPRSASPSSSCSTTCRTRTTPRWTCSPPCWARTSPPRAAALPAPDWLGAYTEPETGLAVRIEAAADGQMRLRYGHFPDRLDLQADGTASSASRSVRLRPGDGGLWMDRPYENQSSRLRPLRRRACQGRRRPLPLRGAGCRADRGRCRRRAVWRFLRLPRAGTHGNARPGRQAMSGCCPVPARWTTRRPATGRWPSDATDRVGSPASRSAAGWPAAWTMHASADS